jgi:hypothetical protein
MPATSESRAEAVARELLLIRGWKVQKPPRGNVLWKNEYRDYPHLAEALQGKSKSGGGDAYPDFLLVDRSTLRPIIVGEIKARNGDIDKAIGEACDPYGDAFDEKGFRVLAAGIAGDDQSNIAVEIRKRARKGWRPVQYRQEPIQWIPTPEEAELLIEDVELFELEPRVPSNEVLAQRGDEINRILRECKIKDEFRPAIIGAFMLALWSSKGEIRMDPRHVLGDINSECRRTFLRANKGEIADSIKVPEANRALASKAIRVCHILRLLNITTLTAEHDYLGQLYEMFFRFTGGNTIGQFFTPRHITSFMVEMMGVSKRDIVVDHTCGTGGFLVSALQRMTEGKPLTRAQVNEIVRGHLKGFESEPITAALCVANMILRGDGTTGIINHDCFTSDEFPEGTATIVIGNPPFPHKKTDEPVERFIERGLEALNTRGRLAMIAPSSLIAKGERGKKDWRKRILHDNSLRGVVTLPSELFQPYASSTTGIVVLEKGVPHTNKTTTFFCRIENDGFRLKKNTRVEQAGSQLPDALDAWQSNRSIPDLCITTAIPSLKEGVEWAPGAYIEFVDHPDEDLRREADLLIRSRAAFEVFNATELHTLQEDLSHGKFRVASYASLSGRKPKHPNGEPNTLGWLFDIYYGQKSLHNKENLQAGHALVISSSGMNNGCYGFFDFDQLIQPPFVTVPSTGSIGEAFVQTWPCGVTDDCLLLIPRSGTDEEDLFLAAAVVRLERWRFDYGRKVTPERIAHMKVRRDAMVKTWIRGRRGPAERIAGEMITVSGPLPTGRPGRPEKQVHLPFSDFDTNLDALLAVPHKPTRRGRK